MSKERTYFAVYNDRYGEKLAVGFDKRSRIGYVERPVVFLLREDAEHWAEWARQRLTKSFPFVIVELDENGKRVEESEKPADVKGMAKKRRAPAKKKKDDDG